MNVNKCEYCDMGEVKSEFFHLYECPLAQKSDLPGGDVWSEVKYYQSTMKKFMELVVPLNNHVGEVDHVND